MEIFNTVHKCYQIAMQLEHLQSSFVIIAVIIGAIKITWNLF